MYLHFKDNFSARIIDFLWSLCQFIFVVANNINPMKAQCLWYFKLIVKIILRESVQYNKDLFSFLCLLFVMSMHGEDNKVLLYWTCKAFLFSNFKSKMVKCVCVNLLLTEINSLFLDTKILMLDNGSIIKMMAFIK